MDHYIVAHAVFTGKEIIKNGRITLQNKVVSEHVSPIKLVHAESARTQFYSGLILPDIFVPKTSVTSLLQIIQEDLNPDDFTMLDASMLSYENLLKTLIQLQSRFNLRGKYFLELWNKISVNIALENAQNPMIEPRNMPNLINIQGIDLNTFVLTEKTKFKKVKL